MNVLSLDPSSKAIGWAVYDATAGLTSGVFRPLDWRASQSEKNQRHRHMCGRAGEWLADVITQHGPSVIIMEVGGGYASDQCSERLRGALFLVTYTREIATATVAPNTWKAWAKRNRLARLQRFEQEKKPDKDAAEMILEWWLSTQAHRVAA